MFYGNAADFKNYLTERGKEVSQDWADSKIESALLVSSEWLDRKFESLWIGYKLTYDQLRSWPRQSAVTETFPSYVYKIDEIPYQVVDATYEAAFRELQKPGCLQVDFTPNKYKSVKVEGAISVEYNTGFTYASDIQNDFPIIDEIMSGLISTDKNGNYSPFSGKAVRA